MPKLIDREATFRTKNIVDGGLGQTSTGLPRLELSLRADEIYDFEEKCWVPWDDVEEREITAYLVLVGHKGNEIFHYKATEKALGWDGASFSSINDIDFQNSGVQFRTKENEYEDKISMQVTGIDHYDAEPGRTVGKLDAAEVKGLDAKYASFFRKRSGEKKPKTVGKPTVPKISSYGASTKTKDPEADAADVPEVPPKKAKSPKTPKKPKKTGCTQNEAWAACSKARDESVSKEKLTEVWLKAVETLAPDSDEDNMSPDLWAQVRDVVVAQVKDDIPF